MCFTRKVLGVFLILLPLILSNTTNAFYDEDYTPQVTARVARITFLQGEAQIKRKNVENWERATQNLPLVEGDEITTGINGRLEIQFDSYNYLRLSEGSYLKLATLRDGGIAVSLPQGTLNLRVLRFNKDNAFIEIDAPQTTLAVQKEGMYRIDAGDRESMEIRLTATEKGEARVYSGNSGFTLKNGRSAKIFLSGNLAGEWEIADASRYVDDFDRWALERDAVIAKRLRESYSDRYYDSEIYGADDLSEYGEWVYTRKYGYVWKPFRNSIASYSNWSPYRYGHWRWIPPYGWTWVNDEPWGWATYHYGRWVWDNGGWYWSPYGRYRWRRSWWSPALVIITYYGGYYCWYPLPYDYSYYNYNAYYYNTTIINNNITIINPTPTPNPSPVPPNPAIATLPKKAKLPPFEMIPQNGVVAVSADQFGKTTNGAQTAPANISRNVLASEPVKAPATPILPNYNQMSGQISRNIVAETPQVVKTQTPIKTGVIIREAGIPMGDRIQKERVLDNRSITDRPTTNTTVNTNPSVRDTGAVTRTETPIRQIPSTQMPSDRNIIRSQDSTPTNDNSVRSTGSGGWNQTDRNTTRNNSNNNQNNQQTDRNTPRNQPQNQTDRDENPPPVRTPSYPPQQNENQRQTPRNETQPSQRNEQPKQQPQQQQRRDEQRPQPQQKDQSETDG